MEIIDYFTTVNQDYWLEEIGKSDWSAGKYLYEIIKNGSILDLIGRSSRLLLLIDGEELISFCTLAEKDDIQPTELSPWMGFVYTFPLYRGNRYIGKLFEMIGCIAEEEGFSKVYISTNEEGLYEKYGCRFINEAKDINGNLSRVYVKEY